MAADVQRALKGMGPDVRSASSKGSGWQPRKDRSWAIIGGLLVVSAVGHVVAYWGANSYAVSLRDTREKQKPAELVMFEVVRPPPPPPPPPPEVVEPPKPAPVRPPPPKVVVKAKPPPVNIAPKDDTPPPPNDAPPPPNDAPPPDATAKPVPLVTGISMSSTSAQGSFAAPVGNTAYGKMGERAVDPSQVQPYRAPEGPRFVPSYQADTQPQVIHQVRLRNSEWPAEARRAGIEGSVIASVSIDAKGNVTAVKLIRGLGYGLDEAALQALRGFRFRPATVKGEPVATEIKYTYTFLLD